MIKLIILGKLIIILFLITLIKMKQEPTNIKLDIPRFIFWIDKNIKTEENQNYLKELQKEFPSYKKETFDSIENLEYFLKKEKKEYDFKFIYIIISGSLAEKFFNSYNIFDYTTIIAANSFLWQ